MGATGDFGLPLHGSRTSLYPKSTPLNQQEAGAIAPTTSTQQPLPGSRSPHWSAAPSSRRRRRRR